MNRHLKLLPLLAVTVGLVACTPPKGLTQAVGQAIKDPTQLANLVGHFSKLVDKYGGKLSAISTKGLTSDSFKDLVALTEGLKTGKLPAEVGLTSLTVTEKKKASAFGVLGGMFQVLETHDSEVGTGGSTPEEETRAESENLKQEGETPIFESASEDPHSSHYGVLDVPSSVDLRPQMPPVRNQGKRGTCVLFSTAGYLDYLYANDPNAPIKHASPEFMNWTYNLYIKSKMSRYKPMLWQDTGSQHPLYHTILREGGMADVVPDKWPFVPPQQGYIGEEDCPYDGNRPYDDANTDFHEAAVNRLGQAVVAKIEAKQPFTAQGARFFKLKHTLATFKSVLAAGQPIQTSVPVYRPDWKLITADNNYQIPEMTDDKAADKANLGSHSVLIVGYKDDASAPGGGWFVMRNSWSEDWADNGYAYLSYDFMSNYTGLCYAAEPYSAPFQATYSITPPADTADQPNTSNCDDASNNPDCVPSPSVPLNAVPTPPVIVAPN